MKIAFSATGKDLDAQIDPRFGRCAFFIIAETDDMSFEVFDNESIALGGGAGIQSSQFVASKGAEVVITGNIGPNAVRTLSAAGLKVILGQGGTVRGALEDFKAGRLTSSSEPNVADHYGMSGGGGMGGGMGRGMGGGMGRGMGGGMGRGMGGGMGRGMGINPGTGQSQSPSGRVEPSDANGLKGQADELRRQLEEIEGRIKNLEKK